MVRARTKFQEIQQYARYKNVISMGISFTI